MKMNKTQRKLLANQQAVVTSRLTDYIESYTNYGLSAGLDGLETAIDNLHKLYDQLALEEYEKFNNLPSQLQMSQRGELYYNDSESFEKASETLKTALQIIRTMVRPIKKDTVHAISVAVKNAMGAVEHIKEVENES